MTGEMPSNAANQVKVEASRTVDAPIDLVWAQVANFNNVAAWHPDVTTCHLEPATATGFDPGDTRVLTLRNGTVVRERLIDSDPQAHRFTYSVLDGQFPLKGHTSTLQMRSLGPSRTEVTWTASFEPAGAPADALAAGIRSGVLELGLQGLAERVRQVP